MASDTTTETREVEELHARLAAAEETLHAIVSGEVDAVVVERNGSPQVYTLKSAAEPYRLLVEKMAQGALTVTGDGLILYCNESFARMTGRSREHIVSEFVHEFVDENNRELLARLLGGETTVGHEISLKTRDGRPLETLISASPLALDGDEIRCLTVTDLSDQELRQQHAAVVQASEAAIYLLDPDLNIRTWNRGAELQTGLSAAQAIGRNERELWPEDARPQLEQLTRRCRQDNAAVTVEMCRRCKNGVCTDLLYTLTPLRNRDGAATGYSVVTHDISVRKAAEQKLRESEARFRIMADNLPLIIWVHDPDGRQQFVNQTFYEYFGLSWDAIPRQRWQTLVHPDDAGVYVSEFEACVREHRPFHGECRVRRADGAWRWLESWGQPRFDPSGEYLGHVGTSADITNRRRGEELRQLLTNELNHRVKNTLAIVQSLALNTFKNLGDAGEKATTAFQCRLAALAAAHNLLTRSNWESTVLEELAVEAVKAGCAPNAPIRIRGPAVTLRPKQTVSFALALHELCTNAVKYGALSTRTGRVDIVWTAESREQTYLNFIWRESGGPAVRPPSRRGFGLRMIERALAAELDGAVDLDFRPEGLVCSIAGKLGDDPYP